MTGRPAVLVITPEMAWRWLTGVDRQLEAQLRELAHVHEEAIQSDGRPPCRLCQGDGRIDDIFCWRCDGSGKEPGGGGGGFLSLSPEVKRESE